MNANVMRMLTMSMPFDRAKNAYGKIQLRISRLTISNEPVLPILFRIDRHRLFIPTCGALRAPARGHLSWYSPTARRQGLRRS